MTGKKEVSFPVIYPIPALLERPVLIKNLHFKFRQLWLLHYVLEKFRPKQGYHFFVIFHGGEVTSKQSTARRPFQEELFCYQSFCIKPLWAELWYNKPFYRSVVGSAVVARAAVEPNWDLHISPARSGKRGHMSQRGTSFGTNIEGLVLVSLVPIVARSKQVCICIG
jgi:hypothetical protein